MIHSLVVDDEMTFFSLFLGLYVTLCFVLCSYLSIIRKRRKQHIEQVFKTLTNGFNNETQIDESDIHIIYRYRASRYYDSYVSFVEAYLLHLRKGNTSDVNNFGDVNRFLKDIIVKERENRPYDDVDESVRRMLLAIEESVQNDIIKNAVKHNLDDLSDTFRKNQKSLRNAKRVNYWTIPISIIGFVLTFCSFIFGTRISNKEYEEFDKHLSLIVKQELMKFQKQDSATNTIGLMENGQ